VARVGRKVDVTVIYYMRGMEMEGQIFEQGMDEGKVRRKMSMGCSRALCVVCR
jgi:hypothetical protein